MELKRRIAAAALVACAFHAGEQRASAGPAPGKPSAYSSEHPNETQTTPKGAKAPVPSDAASSAANHTSPAGSGKDQNPVSQSLDRMAISQVVSAKGSLWTYLDIKGEGGSSVSRVTTGSLVAWLNGKSLPVNSVEPFSSTHQAIGYVLLVDVSGSESHLAFEQVKRALLGFIDHLGADDRATVVTFGSDVTSVVPYTGDKGKLRAAISGLTNRATRTQLNAALDEGLSLSRRSQVDLPLRRAIVILSDGKDEGSGLTTDDIVAHLKENRTPIYAVGASTLPGADRERYLEVLHRIAMLSGGAYYPSAKAGPDASYRQIYDRIAGAWVARLDCTSCQADGSSASLQMRVTLNGGSLADETSVTILPSVPGPTLPPAELPVWKRRKWQVAGGSGAGVLLILGVVGWLVLRGRKKQEGAASPDLLPAFEPERTDGSQHASDAWVPFEFTPPGSTAGEPTIGLDISPELTSRPGVRVELVRKVSRRDAPRAYAAKLVDALVIGRSTGAGLHLPDEEISGQHCRLEVVNGQVTVSDLGSRFGTAVNGVPIQARQKLEPGDLIAMGTVEFHVDLQKAIQ